MHFVKDLGGHLKKVIEEVRFKEFQLQKQSVAFQRGNSFSVMGSFGQPEYFVIFSRDLPICYNDN